MFGKTLHRLTLTVTRTREIPSILTLKKVSCKLVGMKTVRISKKVTALVGTLLLAVVTFFAISMPSQAANEPAPIIPSIGVTLPGVTVTLPPIVRTVTKTVKQIVTVTRVLPRQTTTVTLPGRSTVRTVTLPARTVTETINAVRPAQTVMVKGPVVTKTVVSRQESTKTAILPPVTTTTRITGTPSPAVTTTALVTVEKEKPVIITRTQALLSAVGLAILGALVGILVLGAYRLGWFRGDAGNREFIEETVDDLKYNK